METVIEDCRKKRDSAEVIEGDDVLPKEEKSKKLRANRQTSDCDAAAANELKLSHFQEKDNQSKERSSPLASGNSAAELSSSRTNATRNSSSRQPLDLDVALQHIVRMSDNDESSKEFLSQNQWIKFRIGHAGDAAALAACYRKSMARHPSEKSTTSEKKTPSTTSSSEDTSLEVRLAEGLGDEDTPPSIFALLADVISDKEEAEEAKLGAVALISIAWEGVTRILRVEWMHVIEDDKDFVNTTSLLERRMWLRLSALAMMTSCQMLVAKGVRKTLDKQDDPLL